jgi:hypothetical protein
MNEEARADLLERADKLEEQGKVGQADICRGAAERLLGESRAPLPNQSYIPKGGYLYSDRFVPQFDKSTPPQTGTWLSDK